MRADDIDVGAILGERDPRAFGPWRVLRRLGQGGMGSVYLCVDDDERLAAVKTVNTWLSDSDFRARFRREVAISAKVSGPQVAEVLGHDLDASTPWLALRYVPGPTLAEVISRRGPLNERDLRSLAVGLMQGLALIHAVGITHRDLKPSNVIWHDRMPVIIDFGISRSSGGTAITSTAQTIGTAGWMAPEQILGGPAASPADVFAWAAVVSYAATGRPPFGTGSVESLTYRVIHTEPDLQGVPDGLHPVVAAGLRKEPRERPDPATILSALAGGTGVSLEPPTLPKPSAAPPTLITPRRSARRRGVVITVGLVAATVVFGAAGAGLIALLGHKTDAGAPSASSQVTPRRPSQNASSEAVANPAATSKVASDAEPTPELQMTIVPFTDDVDELTTFLAEHQQEAVVLDIAVSEPPGGTVEDAVYYSPKGEPANFTIRPSQAGYGGVELVIQDFASTPDASMYWMRGEMYLQGRFAVQGDGGMHQGVESFGLRALPID